MNTRKKLIITFITLGVAIVAVLGVTFGVLAAQRQSVANQFSVNFVADNVSADIQAYYIPKNGETVYFTHTVNNIPTSSITIVPETNEARYTLVAPNVTLTPECNSVKAVFKFTNTASAGGRSVAVNFVQNNSDMENVIVRYWFSKRGNLVNTVEYVGIYYEEATSYVAYIEPGETIYYYMLIEIVDLTINASFIADDNDLIFAFATESELPENWYQMVAQMEAAENQLYPVQNQEPDEQVEP